MSNDKATIAATTPIKTELEAGKTYYWCTCGLSKKQPFCDGSHASTDFKPQAFTADSDGDAYLCQCKATANPPFCDGSHKKLGDAAAGDAVPHMDQGGAPKAVATPEEPSVAFIHELARDGLSKMGLHGPMDAMGVPRKDLPDWDDIQILTAQMATKPLLDDATVGTDLILGPRAKKPLRHPPICL